MSEEEFKCPDCGYDGCFDVYACIGGCEGEVTKIHCPNCDAIFDPRIYWKKEAED